MHRQITFILILIILIIFQLSFTIVHEGNNAILTRFNKVVKNQNHDPIVLESGIHFKIPFIDVIKISDNRIHTLNVQLNHVFSKEEKEIIVNYYIKWRISDFQNYYLSTGGNDYKTEILLDHISNDILRTKISNLNIKDIIRDLNINLVKDFCDSLKNSKTSKTKKMIDTVNSEHSKRHTSVLNSNIMQMLGIKIIDMQINNIDLPNNEISYLFNRISSERLSIAQNKILEGEEEAKNIQKKADYQATIIIDEAKRDASIIRGDTDLQVTKIFTDSFKNDIEFYMFIKSLNAYKKIFDKNRDLIILNFDNEFFKYMKHPFINIH
ncbi:protease modulator HflC [Candidatus Pantoea edessiphila]|uniref:Protein HflC n=1 Tax=Candidatus Pantoea edessiphila TaxID=2044610 RepID=A0A2P5SXR1_9GAMM|nr:protease modulator HflC [Candidatus Pantoea edessiphila]MBK4775729.1 protease modulator HflC [Pantoea sp. Edef]PPI87126.1 protease modulator HflC [Candidatus Pantoea edessiphila]